MSVSLINRPNRKMHELGPEVIATTNKGHIRAVYRQVGWLGQSGYFYTLTEDPTEFEKGGFTPLYFVAHADTVPANEETEDSDPDQSDSTR